MSTHIAALEAVAVPRHVAPVTPASLLLAAAALLWEKRGPLRCGRCRSESKALEAQDSAIAIGSRLASAADYPCRIGEKVVGDTGAAPRWPSRRAPASSGLALALCLWLLWVANFNDLQFGGTDALRPYSLVQRIFGETSESVGTPIGYQYGLAYLWVPFYGIGRLLSAVGIESAEGEPIGVAAIALGTSLLVVGICALLLPVLRGLRVRHEAFALTAGVFGTPLFFYGSFTTGLTHVADTLLVSALVLLTYRYFQSPRPAIWLPLAMGAVGGYAMSVRLFNGFVVAAVVLGFLIYRRFAAAVILSAVAATSLVALAGIAFLLGVSSVTSGQAGADFTDDATWWLTFNPDTPLRMLFSERGLFAWTPVTLLGGIGFVVLLWNRRDVRPFLVVVGMMGVALITPYAFVSFLSRSYSQRYWTPLFPIVVLGIAALTEFRPRVAFPAVTAAAVWSVALAFYTAPGLGYVDGSAFQFPARVVRGEITPTAYAHAVYHRARLLNLFPDPFDHSEPASLGQR